MYKVVTIRDRLRVSPDKFGGNIQKAIKESIIEKFNGMVNKNMYFLAFIGLKEVGDGIIVPGDGAVFYDSIFEFLAYEPELQEVTEGIVSEISEFGAFVNIGPIEGLSHLSQVMDDYVSYSKTGALSGKKSKKTLSVKDQVRARVIAVSLKALKGAKIGLTMRQPGLGKLDWIESDKIEKTKPVKTKAKKKVKKK